MGPRVYPRLKIQEVKRALADIFFALFLTFAMTALKLHRVCVRELACNMHFFCQSAQDAQLELSAHSLPCDKEVDRITVLHNVEGFALVMLCRSVTH